MKPHRPIALATTISIALWILVGVFAPSWVVLAIGGWGVLLIFSAIAGLRYDGAP